MELTRIYLLNLLNVNCMDTFKSFTDSEINNNNNLYIRLLKLNNLIVNNETTKKSSLLLKNNLEF